MNDALETVNEEIPAALQQFVEADDKPVDPPKDDKPAEQQQQQDQVDPLVEKARASGHVDKETWIAQGKDADAWVDAGEFLRRAPLFDELKKVRRENKDLHEKLDGVTKFATKAQEVGYKKAIAELEAKRLEAVETGDVEAFHETEKQIEEVRKEFEPLIEPEVKKPEQQQEEIPAPVKEFAERNEKWFEKDKAMTVFMVSTTQEYTAQGKPLDEAIRLAEADTKKAFAHKFVNPKKDEPSPVASGNREQRGKTFTYNDLNAGQRAVYSALKKTGMSIDQFIKDLQAQGELK